MQQKSQKTVTIPAPVRSKDSGKHHSEDTAESKVSSNSESQAKDPYIPAEIEPYWQSKWQQEKVYQPNLDSAKRPFYNLMMFPYPSAEGLHVGSFFTYGGIDAYGRFKRMQGYDVFEPIGLDGFGIHSENYAIKVGRTPQEHAKISEENFYRQLHTLGNGFDWSRKLETYDPNYYKWTQWLFIELFKAGLAYKDKASVNYCPSCKTVLSDEQVLPAGRQGLMGSCERCGTVVEKKELKQWFFRITEYAERLLTNTAKLDWTDKVKIAQKNWIGKKSGIDITYKVENRKENITVFTTRPDTNFGATFIALAPENLLSLEITTLENKEAVKSYIEKATMKSDIERQAEGKDKTGVFTGAYAINDLTGYRMPIWVSDFVLADFGTGALVGVPGHDKRDFEFAQKFGLEIKRVVIGKDGDASGIERIEQVQEENGKMVNSEFLDGMDIHAATIKIMDYMEEKGYAKRVVTYHLRDWLISRQRYWGPPIPMIYCESCAQAGKSWFTMKDSRKYHVVSSKNENNKIHNTDYKLHTTSSAGWYPEENLPVLLPEIKDFRPLGTGNSPLGNHPEFYETTCPGCGGKATRETDVSDTFLDSSWYFFRYLATDKHDSASDMSRIKTWMPVHSYIGGAEHAVLHLLYSRFITMVLHDLKHIYFEEPFAKFRAHGLIIKDGAKMSKSKGNVINPDEYVRKFGADTLRTYLGFVGPFTQGGDFQDTGIEGMNRFLKRVWRLVSDYQSAELREKRTRKDGGKGSVVSLNSADSPMRHKTIQGVTEDMEELRFNTAIAKIMTYYNFLSDQPDISREEIEVLLKLLSPFAPHLTEELWGRISTDREQIRTDQRKSVKTQWKSIHKEPWPVYDPNKVVSDAVVIAVQINGKLRDTIEAESEKLKVKSYEAEITQKAKESPNVKKYLEGNEIKKVIYVPGKIVNFVI